MTNTERKILQKIHIDGPITRIDCEAIGVDLETFLDVMAKLKWLGWVTTEFIEVKKESGSPREILQYGLSQRFKQMFEFKTLMP